MKVVCVCDYNDTYHCSGLGVGGGGEIRVIGEIGGMGFFLNIIFGKIFFMIKTVVFDAGRVLIKITEGPVKLNYLGGGITDFLIPTVFGVWELFLGIPELSFRIFL